MATQYGLSGLSLNKTFNIGDARGEGPPASAQNAKKESSWMPDMRRFDGDPGASTCAPASKLPSHFAQHDRVTGLLNGGALDISSY